MKIVAVIFLALSAHPLAAQTSIPDLISLMNAAAAANDPKSYANLFTPEGELWQGPKHLATGRNAIARAFHPHGIWMEFSPLEIVKSPTVTGDTAVLAATQTHYDKPADKRELTLVLKRRNGVWKIASLR